MIDGEDEEDGGWHEGADEQLLGREYEEDDEQLLEGADEEIPEGDDEELPDMTDCLDSGRYRQ